MNPVLSKSKTELGYKFLFENSTSSICLTNFDGELIDFNENFAKVTGVENPKNDLSLNIDTFFTDHQGKSFSLANSNSIENPTNQLYLYLITKSKAKIPCLVSVKHIEINKTLHFIININEINKEITQQKGDLSNIDDKDKQIELLKKKLAVSENKFNKLLQLSGSAVCIQSESRLLFVNPAWEEMTGYSFEDVKEQPPCQIIHPEHKKLAQNRMMARLRNKKVPEKYDLKIVTKSGQEIWVNAKVSVVEYEGERCLMTDYVDVTERVRNRQAMKESKKKFQSLFYENNSIMFVVDPKNGDIVDANEAACKFYGYSTAKIKSLNINDISALSKEEIQQQIDEAMNGKREHHLFKHRLANNEIRDVEVYSGKVEIKETILLYSVVHDITARKKAEEALIKSKNELKQLNAQKDRFFSIIAHDLRGPLGALMQMTEFMQENFDDFSNEEFKKYFGHLYSSAKGTFKLLENLLVWTRSQLGALVIKPEKIDLHKLTDEIVTLYSQSALAKEIKLENNIKEGLFALADKNTVATILRNLISNAIKFTPKHGNITLLAKPIAQNNNEMLEVCVKDNGLGIPEDKIDKLFKIEENYSTTGTSNEKGTGLGLVLCNELVQKNGGNIRVTSKTKQGTSFYFTLPVAKRNGDKKLEQV